MSHLPFLLIPFVPINRFACTLVPYPHTWFYILTSKPKAPNKGKHVLIYFSIIVIISSFIKVYIRNTVSNTVCFTCILVFYWIFLSGPPKILSNLWIIHVHCINSEFAISYALLIASHIFLNFLLTKSVLNWEGCKCLLLMGNCHIFYMCVYMRER